jgi:chromodomain-helicase-DNA-binding protein 7
MHLLHQEKNIRGPFLVIAPLSTVGHWKRECETWTWMNCVVYHGNSEDREILKAYEFYYQSMPANRKMPKFNLIITTNEIFMKDSAELSKFRW